jgi:hypothetical protein
MPGLLELGPQASHDVVNLLRRYTSVRDDQSVTERPPSTASTWPLT